MMASKRQHALIMDVWRDEITGELIRITNESDRQKMNGYLKSKHNRFKFVRKSNVDTANIQ